MFPNEAELSQQLRDNPLMNRPVAGKPLGSAYAVSLYVRSAYALAHTVSARRDLEACAVALRSLREPGILEDGVIAAA
ncbi:MAG: hypothetical protein JWQ83_402 [Lacunisphaera sp.]|nr:hypothetical protein [Lacunisphaera sp.]